MHIPNASETRFTDVSNCDWDDDIVRCAGDRAAVQRYFEAIDRGFLGQAIRERYAFDGQVGLDGIVQDTEMTIDELVISDLQEFLDDNDDRLEATKTLSAQGLANADDPGIGFLRTMISMMDADPPTARHKRALRARLTDFQEENELDTGKVGLLLDILLDILLEE